MNCHFRIFIYQLNCAHFTQPPKKMGLDYYAILCLQRDTNVANIALA